MSMIETQIAEQLRDRIASIERGTDLKRIAIISRTGMRIATATSASMDADAETGSSAALIELSNNLSDSVNHGGLREIVVKAEGGFVILQHINSEYMVFGGISNPLRVGFYLEYMRNETKKFAYILAGNQVTDELKKEIEAQKERSRLAETKAIGSLKDNFKSDRSASQDLEALEGVLGFLDDWSGDDDGQPTPEAGGTIGIDQDMMFGFEDMNNLTATSISSDEIDKARGVKEQELGLINAETQDEEDAMFDALSALDEMANQTISSAQSSTTTENDDGALPDDILSTLNEIAETASVPSNKEKTKEQKEEALPYGIKIYNEEVPPVPLQDYVSFEVGSFTSEGEISTKPQSAAYSAPETEYQPQQEPIAQDFVQKEPPAVMSNEFGDMPIGDDGEPDFNALIASEYIDEDMGLEEDALVDALAELERDDKKKNL